MNSNVAVGVMVGALLTMPSAAHAQDPVTPQDPARTVEFTPYVALASGTAKSVGAAARWPLASNLSMELEVGQRYAEMKALGASANLMFDFPSMGRATAYAIGGLGLEQYGYATGAPGALVTHQSTAFTVNAGGGVRVPIDDRWGVRSDVRWFNPLGKDAPPERFRLYNGVTIGTKGR